MFPATAICMLLFFWLNNIAILKGLFALEGPKKRGIFEIIYGDVLVFYKCFSVFSAIYEKHYSKFICLFYFLPREAIRGAFGFVVSKNSKVPIYRGFFFEPK